MGFGWVCVEDSTNLGNSVGIWTIKGNVNHFICMTPFDMLSCYIYKTR